MLQEYLKKIVDLANNPQSQSDYLREFLKGFCKMENYYVVSPWTEKPEEIRQYVGYYQLNTPCYYVFTNPDIARDFAYHYNMCSKDNKALILSVPSIQFSVCLEQFHKSGVKLIMFDEGRFSACCNIEFIKNAVNSLYSEDLQ